MWLNLACFAFFETLFLRFALLPYKKKIAALTQVISSAVTTYGSTSTELYQQRMSYYH